MDGEDIHHGSCFCGAIRLEARGAPEAMGYCHCASCRRWSAAPVNAFTLWKPDAVTITHGAAQLGSYRHTPRSNRRWCTVCGGHVLTEHPGLGLTDVYAAVLPELAFRPTVHAHCQESVLSVADDVPKLRDIPAELGGSGEPMVTG